MPVFLKAIPGYEKCFMDQCIDCKPTLTSDTVLRGEEYHFEVAYTTTETGHDPKCQLILDSDGGLPFTIETVEQIPVRVPCYHNRNDDYYLRKEPGLYPDLLVPIENGARIFAVHKELRALYVTVKVPENAAPGEYKINIRFKTNEGITHVETSVTLRVIAATLPEQDLKVTKWFHSDCIASYYELEIFSEKHWSYIENFIRTAVENGCNMILTPVFTPPLDTAVGGERPTVQLVDVEKTDCGWKFGFDRLERWVEMCNRCGMKFFEVSHLFTQWGAGHAPKIIAKVNGKLEKVFGWETDSLSPEYTAFLRAFLKAFLAKMKSLAGADKRCIFHISDEPALEHLEAYKAAKASIADLLEGYTIIDALSNFEFYKTGALTTPIPANDHITPFLDADIEGLWTYYCCGQTTDVSNQFVAMSMNRTRIIGAQMWKFGIAGFLQWGYNFWFSQGSVEEINPYYVTDGQYFVPAGDAYVVYPGPKGQPYTSLHLKAFLDGVMDNRLLKLAESLCGREAVLAALEEGIDPITFAKYPHDDNYLPGVRAKIHALIEGALNA